jgi:hypothetical protein
MGMTKLLPLLLLAACAAPIGTKAVNPVCLRHCVSTVVEAGPTLQRLTTHQDYRNEARLF